MSIGRSPGAGSGAAGVEEAEERAQAARAEERGGGLRLYHRFYISFHKFHMVVLLTLNGPKFYDR